MTVLKAVRIRADDPCLLEVVTGSGKTLEVIDGVVVALSFVSIFTGGGGGSANSTWTSTFLAAAPAGRQGEVASLVEALLLNPGAASSRPTVS